ncbi:restriction endonuclease NmeDIP [Brevibacillus formosus]|nr:restriction endonuclease NmeDIP [Brevibacillus formosus]
MVHSIGLLPRDRTYNYINPRTRTVIRIEDVVYPSGPILIRRWNPTKGESYQKAKLESISSEMIWRIANAFFQSQPINFDRVLGASYNTRSVLETLIAYTPEFYYCYPGRIEMIGSNSSIERGHKHIIWCPDQPHEMGQLVKIETDIVISEVPNSDVVYEALVLSDESLSGEIDIEVKRRHTQMQIALIEIGKQLGFRTYIAQNDMGITYKDKKIGELESVVPSLRNENIMRVYTEAAHSARLIDCIWFKNGSLMPAVIEVEHSTGVTSGLTRMLGLYNHIKGFQTRYVIVAPDEDREKVVREANREEFLPLNTRFFPYSAVEELYSLCNKRKIKGVTEEFLDCYMEPTINLLS